MSTKKCFSSFFAYYFLKVHVNQFHGRIRIRTKYDGSGRPKNRQIRIHCSTVKPLKSFNRVGWSPVFLLSLEKLACRKHSANSCIFVRFFFVGVIHSTVLSDPDSALHAAVDEIGR
jgi:hypothetical protein